MKLFGQPGRDLRKLHQKCGSNESRSPAPAVDSVIRAREALRMVKPLLTGAIPPHAFFASTRQFHHIFCC
jgi:hypothetical protein